MGQPSEKQLTAGHRALVAVINERFEGNKCEAARAADEGGFPESGQSDRRADLIQQQIIKLSNGYVQRPGLDSLLWFQEHWGIPVALWLQD